MTTKDRRIEIRVSDAERELEEAAASAAGVTLSEFIRGAARVEAERVLAERARFQIEDDDVAVRFLAALDDDARHTEGLERLVAKPSVLQPR